MNLHRTLSQSQNSLKFQINIDYCLVMLLNLFYSQIVQQLVDKQLRALQVTIFDKHFKELKDRVDRIDCSVKHQTAINALQVSRQQQ